MPKPLKIVHMTSVHRPFDVRIFEKQCRSLASRGHEVVLIAVHDRNETRHGVTIRALPKPRNQRRRMTVTAYQVFRQALREQADLYQIHDAELLPWALLLRLMGKTVVYDMHEHVPKDICTKTWLPNWARPVVATLIRLAERILFIRLPIVFAESSYARDYQWVRRSVVVLNLPSLELLPKPNLDRFPDFRVGYIGGVAADRGSEATIKALAKLHQRGHEVGWECVGPMWPPDHEQQLRSLAASLGVTQLNLHGYVPSSEGWPIMSRCHAGLAVLAPSPNFVESFPTKLFEYMALELPVVTSNFPLYREVVESARCGFCIDPDSPDELADALERLVEHPEQAAEMGRQGRQAVLDRYNWGSEFARLEGFYEQLL